MFSGRLTADEITAKGFDTAYVSFGSYVPRGPHLPMDSCIRIAHSFAERISDEVNAYMLPVQPFAYNAGNEKYSAGLSPGLLYELAFNLLTELWRQGYGRLVIQQCGIGTEALYPLVRHMNANERIKAVVINPYSFINTTGDYHAGEIETSLAMYLFGGSVRAEKIKGIDYTPDVPLDELDLKPIQDICPGWVWGVPSRATVEKGKDMFDTACEGSVKYLRAAFDFMDKNGDYTGGRETNNAL